MQSLIELGLTNALLAAILAVVVYAATRFIRSSHLAHFLWLLVLLKLLTPPLIHVPILPEWTTGDQLAASPSDPPIHTPWTDRLDSTLSLDMNDDQELPSFPDVSQINVDETPVEAIDPAAQTGLASPSPAPTRWTWWIAMVWLTGSITWSLVAARRIVRFHYQLRQTADAPEEVGKLAERVAREMGLRRPPLVRLVHCHVPPLLWPIGRSPTVVIPGQLVGQLSAEQFETILAHEFAHIRRRDHWVRWLEVVCTVAYWWHPALWLARRELRTVEEQCCDALVLAIYHGRSQTYGEALFKVIDYASAQSSAPPILVSGMRGAGQTKRRIEMILSHRLSERLSRHSWVGLIVLGLIILPLSAGAYQKAGPGPASDAQSPVERREAAGFFDRKVQQAMREYVKNLAEIYAKVSALNSVGTEGGEAEKLHLAGYELSTAKAELAVLEGRHDDAVTRFEEAVSHAEMGYRTALTQYEVGLVTLRSLLQYRKYLLRSKLRLIEARRERSAIGKE